MERAPFSACTCYVAEGKLVPMVEPCPRHGHPQKIPKKARKLFAKARHTAHKHAVIVYRGSNIVAQGFNHDEIHAEVAALKKLWPSERAGTKVVSLRMTRGGRLGLAKPCEECEAYMRENGVKLVLFSNAKGQIERMRL